MVTRAGCKCGHRTHDTWGCLNPECGCDTPRDRVLVDAAVQAERDRLLARIEELAAASFDAYLSVAPMVRMRCVAEHDLRALLAEERAR